MTLDSTKTVILTPSLKTNAILRIAILGLVTSGIAVSSTWMGCSGADKSAETMAAQKTMAAGQISAAQGQLSAVLTEVPQDPTAATSMAHIHLLNGDFEQAEAVLNLAQSDDPVVQSQIALRKALIALEAKDFSKAKELALTSNEDFAKVLCAEISLMDGEYDEAKGYLEKVGGSHASLARQYISLLDGSEWSQAYAEAQALWALRDFDLAIQSVSGTLEFIGKSDIKGNYDDHVILWASRAVAVAQPDIAEGLLETKGFQGQDDLRVAVLKAMIQSVRGDVSGGKAAFAALEGKVSPQAIHDAKATTVVVLSSLGKDGSALLAGLRGTTGAYAAYKAGQSSKAQDMVDTDTFERFLQGGL